ncbi:hypothetical protein M8C21_020720 [Ambrosia artemisiifolia]|uniref:Uncharacterized protein n=1 Tax=Ambrosia artemisiifolia TaxID=4212 RepID=A0AAD5GFC0_AMBAR|nr:hypothetical protein M8C21_020720 [Ambrosia artemisiifolia]
MLAYLVLFGKWNKGSSVEKKQPTGMAHSGIYAKKVLVEPRREARHHLQEPLEDFSQGMANAPNTVVRKKLYVMLVWSKTKPGNFVKSIQYLLVLAIPVEMVHIILKFSACQMLLIGVCCSGSGDGSDPYAKVSGFIT